MSAAGRRRRLRPVRLLALAGALGAAGWAAVSAFEVPAVGGGVQGPVAARFAGLAAGGPSSRAALLEPEAPPDYVEAMLQTLHQFPVKPAELEQGAEAQPLVELPEGTAECAPPWRRQAAWRWAALLLATAAVTAALRAATVWLSQQAHAAPALDGLAAGLGGPWHGVLSSAGAGLGAGALHTLSGPDHLAGLAPLALSTRGGPAAAFRTGVFWGSGHVLGQSLLGVLLVAVANCPAVARSVAKLGLGAFAEQAATLLVGAVLVTLGSMGLREAAEWREETDGESRGGGQDHGKLSWKTFSTGLLSGMHPDALLLCLPALALPRLAGFSFLGAFAAGTLFAMGTYTAALRCAAHALGPRVVKTVSAVSSGVALAVGVAVCGAALGLPGLRGLL